MPVGLKKEEPAEIFLPEVELLEEVKPSVPPRQPLRDFWSKFKDGIIKIFAEEEDGKL